MDLYNVRGFDRPDARKRPLVLFIHGGAWMTGTKRDRVPIKDFPGVLVQVLAQRDYVVAAIEYRLDGDAPFPAAIRDVRTAIRFLARHAGVLGIDPDRIGAFGGSAGGHLTALAATGCGERALEIADEGGKGPGAPLEAGVPQDDAPACLQAAVAWFGVYDFVTVPKHRGPEKFLGCGDAKCSDAVMARASPITYVDGRDPPILLISGTADTLVDVSQQHQFADALRKAGVPVETLLIEGVDHGFVGDSDARSHAANLEALQATFEFLDRRLGARP